LRGIRRQSGSCFWQMELLVLKPLISPGSKSVTNKILKKIGVDEQKTNFTIFRW
jgi:hypothetical protein